MARILPAGREVKVVSQPTNGPFQNSPRPIEPDPTSTSVPPTGSKVLSSRRMGKNSAPRLSKAGYPPCVARSGDIGLKASPVVVVEESAQQDDQAINCTEDEPCSRK